MTLLNLRRRRKRSLRHPLSRRPLGSDVAVPCGILQADDDDDWEDWDDDDEEALEKKMKEQLKEKERQRRREAGASG